MATSGDTVEHPVTRERITFLETLEETGGEYATFELRVRPHGFVATPHVHPIAEESFEIRSGTFALVVDSEERQVRAGEGATVPAGATHAWWNAGEEEGVAIVEFRPALQSEEFFESFFGLPRDGKVSQKTGLPNLLWLASIFRAYHDFGYIRGRGNHRSEGGIDVYPKANEILIRPEEGAHLPVLDITHKVTAGASGGSVMIEEWGLPPGEMIPPHTHAREDECSYLLEGELTCYVGGEVVLAPTGSYVVKPRGVPHAFYNAGIEKVRVMEILTPGDSFEGYFDAYEEIALQNMSHLEHQKTRAELGERYGITWHEEMISEVEARFGIGR